MPAQLVALGGKDPQIDALGSFGEGERQQVGVDQAKRKAVEEKLQLVGAASMHALGGNINGQADPAKFEQGLDMLQSMGMNVEQFRGKPEMASVAARASIDALHQVQMANDDKQLDLAAQKFSHDLMNDDRQYEQGNRRLDIEEKRIEKGDTPSGYHRNPDGSLAFDPGGPYDPKNPLNTRKVSGGPMSVTAQKELFDADESVQSGENVVSQLQQAIDINDDAYSGIGAGPRGYAASLVGVDAGEKTENLKNLVLNQALGQLRATFGAAPTEGERQILLELQGSVNQSATVRKDIFTRAKALAEKRMNFNKRKAKALRDNTYFTDGPGDSVDTTEGADPLEGKTASKKDAQGNVIEKLVRHNGQWVPAQ